MLGKIRRRFAYWLDRSQRSRRLRDEMESHLEMKVEEFMEQGLPESEARARARREFGNVTRLSEESRGIWIARWATDLAQDLRYAARTLVREPGFAAVAILSAALGIGACSTIFGIASFALLYPLPVAEPDGLVAIVSKRVDSGSLGGSSSYPELEDLRREAKSLDGVAGYSPVLAASIAVGNDAQRFWGAVVSANFFDVVKPGFTAGRGFDPADDRQGSAPVIVLSHHLWRGYFGADPNIVGRKIHFNGRQVQVAGVASLGFRGPDLLLISDFWVPMSMIGDLEKQQNDPGDRFAHRDNQWLSLIGRITAGSSIEQARTEIELISRRLGQHFPEQRNRTFHVERAGQLHPGLRRAIFGFFTLLLIVTLLVLLIACANVANLLLARAASRQRELATRLAIGASRGRLIRQLLAESVLLAALGSIAGLLLAYWAASSLSKFRLPLPMPIDLSVQLDYRIVFFALGLSILTGILFGLLPAWRASRTSLAGAMKNDPVLIVGLRRFGLRNLLIVGQVAVSLMLLVCSGLFLRSLYTARSMDFGVRSRNVLFMTVDPSLNRYTTERSVQFFRTLLERASALPGVESASLTSAVPLTMSGNSSRVLPDNKLTEDPARAGQRVDIYVVAPGYFDTFGIALRQGRDFPNASNAPEAAIINETLAQRAFPGSTPIGRRLQFHGRTLEVIGVAANSRSRTITEDPAGILYLPLFQSYGYERSLAGVTLAVKTQSEPALLTEAMRREIRSLDPTLAIADIKTMETHLTNALFLPRLGALMFGLCGGIGLLIATIGIYGVVSFAVARRTREIAIRMALGAKRGQVLRMVLKHGLAVALVGSAIGLAAALAISRLAASLLFGISATDLITFVGVPLLLIAVALLASFVPAHRAAQLDPSSALRYD